MNHTEQGPAGPHAAGPEGGTVKTTRGPEDSTASMDVEDVVLEGQVWSSNVEVEEQSGEQSGEQSAEQTGLEDGDPPAGPQGQRGRVKLFLVDRLFLTAPHVKGV